jgi:molecular chaperone GrpE
MQDKDMNQNEEKVEKEEVTNETDIKAETTPEPAVNTELDKSAELDEKVKELNDKYLRLYSEFDNYRKRTLKEKAEIIKTASEDVFKAVIPIIDDFERAIKANETIEDVKALKEGVSLIYNKLKNITQQKGLTALESIGEVFNPDLMEAITEIETGEESKKGKVIDEVEKGYKLGEKVIRFAKVVVGK